MIKLVAIGYLGQNAEIKMIGDNEYISFSVAVSEKRKQSSGEQKEITTWLNCLYKGGEKLKEHLKKGTKVYIEGNFKVSIYQIGSENYVNLAVMINQIEIVKFAEKEEKGN